MEVFEQPQKIPRTVDVNRTEQAPHAPETFEVHISRQLQKLQETVDVSLSRQAESIKETQKPGEDRIVLLTDGIFAIALTLLVLSIELPSATSASELNTALAKDFFPHTLSYVITFAVLISYWLGHRRLMNLLERVDRTFVQINVVFLAIVAFFPVTNGLLDNSQFPVADVIYTVVLVACGYCSSLLWFYALWHHRLVANEVDIKRHTHLLLNSTSIPTFFLVSLLLLLVPGFPPGHLYYSWLIIPLVTLLYNLIVKPRTKNSQTDTYAERTQ